MNVKAGRPLAGMLLLVSAALVITAAHAGPPKPTDKNTSGIFHLSQLRGPLRAVDISPLGKDVSSEIVAGPANGLDSAFLIYTRMPAGAHGPKMYTLPVDHTYLVLSGQMNVQLGTDKFVAGPKTLVLAPAGVPQEVWNTGSEPVTAIEAITPAPSSDLLSLMKPAEPRKIENAAQYIRTAQPIADPSRGVNSQPLAARATDSEHVLERIDNVNAGFGMGNGLHIHAFDQVYFILEGTMSFQYGLTSYDVKANTFVIIPAGVVHQNKNNGPGVERHVTLLLPEPVKQPFDVPVEFKTVQPPK